MPGCRLRLLSPFAGAGDLARWRRPAASRIAPAPGPRFPLPLPVAGSHPLFFPHLNCFRSTAATCLPTGVRGPCRRVWGAIGCYDNPARRQPRPPTAGGERRGEREREDVFFLFSTEPRPFPFFSACAEATEMVRVCMAPPRCVLPFYAPRAPPQSTLR